MQGTIFFSFLLFAINKAYFFLINPRNIISNIIMIFNINSTPGHTGSLLVVTMIRHLDDVIYKTKYKTRQSIMMCFDVFIAGIVESCRLKEVPERWQKLYTTHTPNLEISIT